MARQQRGQWPLLATLAWCTVACSATLATGGRQVCSVMEVPFVRFPAGCGAQGCTCGWWARDPLRETSATTRSTRDGEWSKEGRVTPFSSHCCEGEDAGTMAAIFGRDEGLLPKRAEEVLPAYGETREGGCCGSRRPGAGACHYLPSGLQWRAFRHYGCRCFDERAGPGVGSK